MELMKKDEINRQFDKLLGAMAPPVSGQTIPSSGQASDEEHDAYCSDIQTRPNTSKDASR